jgi:hypothetical protein
MIFDVNFAPEETKEIVNTFSMKSIGELQSPPLSAGPWNLSYTLKSGRSWANTIVSAKIFINFIFPSIFMGTLEIHLDNYVLQEEDETRISFDFKDFKPDSDIVVEFNTPDFDTLPVSVVKPLLSGWISRKENRWLSFFSEAVLSFGTFESLKDPSLFDLMRKTFFTTANEYYSMKNYDEARGWYAAALGYLYKKNFNGNYTPSWSDDWSSNLTMQLPSILQEWKDEKTADAPGYFCAYNIACCYSLILEEISEKDKHMYVDKAFEWLSFALQMNKPLITSYMKKDPDLRRLATADPDRFNSLLGD